MPAKLLDTTAISDLLRGQVVGRLACSLGRQPYVVPVTYMFDGKYIYGQTNVGKKLKILRKNPNVCFEVDLLVNGRKRKMVIITGKFEELKNKQAEKARDLLFSHLFPLMTSSTIHNFGHATEGKVDDSTRVKQVMYRIKIKKMTGRFEKQ